MVSRVVRLSRSVASGAGALALVALTTMAAVLVAVAMVPAATATTTAPAARDGGQPAAQQVRVAPYVDVTLPDQPTLAEVANRTGVDHFTLAFIIGSSQGCVPTWGAKYPLDSPKVIGQIEELRAQGGDVVIAFGGALGPYMSQVCGSAAELADAYRKVVEATGATHLDFDIEAAYNTADKINTAAAMVQETHPQVKVSYTLAVQSPGYGLTPAAVDVVESAVEHGVDVHVVNAMAMNFAGDGSDMGQAVTRVGSSVLEQLSPLFPNRSEAEMWRTIGITPMIGVNNVQSLVFRPDDAQQLVSWAGQQNIGFLAFWSVGRDHGCPGGGVSPTCSGIGQADFEFTEIFGGFTG